jgi:hypothetical protein
MQTTFNENLRRVRLDLEDTASYYLTQHAHLMEQAQTAHESAIYDSDIAGATKAKEQLATLENRQKAWETYFNDVRNLMKKVAP